MNPDTSKAPQEIICAIFQPFVARTILYTNILSRLATEGHKVTVLVPAEKRDFYSARYPDLIFVGISLTSLNATIIRKIHTLLEYAFLSNIKSFHAREILAQDKNYSKYALRLLAMHTIGRSHLLQSWLRRFFIFATRTYSTGFESHVTADMVVLSCDIYNEYDVLLLIEAKRRNLKTLGMVRSWDNNYSKTLLPIIPDVVITQNDIMSKEVRSLHGASKNIVSVGIPYYETYKQHTPISKELLYTELGIPLDAKLVLFSPAGNKFISHDWHFCQILKDAIQSGALPPNTYVLVRCHPSNTCDLSQFVPDEHFIIETPGTSFGGPRQKDTELDFKSIEHLIDEITHASVVINILSSIIIDAAVIGTPVVTPCFEGRESHAPFLRSIQRFQAEENMELLLRIWKGSMPTTESDLVNELARVLGGDTKSDTEAHERILSSYCKDFDKSPQENLYTVIREHSISSNEKDLSS